MPAVSIVIEEGTFGDEEEGDLTAWTKDDGDTVVAGTIVAEVSTSKVIVEIVAPADGVLRHRCRPGEVVRHGQTIGVIESDG